MIILLFPMAGYAAKRPVLYPNVHFKSVGKVAAEHDINECIELARANGVNPHNGSDIAASTAGGAAVGGAVGAAAGATRGHAGPGAAAGAAGGVVGGLARGILRSNGPDPVFRHFVNKCLRIRGYDPIGWR